ncbi:MAG: DUF202 domain-containing protein [Nanoarchaeota archaeon]
MADDIKLMAEKRTHLAEKRTELAHERTVLAYLRTAATIILFGIAFIGLSGARGDFFFYAGRTAVAMGVLFLIAAAISGLRHSHEISLIRTFFEKAVHFTFRKK